MRVGYAAVILSAILFAGCTTVVVDRAQHVSAAGKDYVETLKKVNTLALDKSIALSATVLAENNYANGTRDMSMLTDTTAEMQKRNALVSGANDYFNGISAYFDALAGLAKDNQSTATENAVGKLADNLKKEPVGLNLSDAKKKALTGLAGYVATQVHAASVEKALKRDADTVAQSLALTEKMLDEEIRWITIRENAERQKNFNLKVAAPYKNQPAVLDDKWKEAWSGYVKTSPAIELLTHAKKSSIDMQESWKNVLRGDYSLAEVRASIQDVKKGIGVIAAIKDAK